MPARHRTRRRHAALSPARLLALLPLLAAGCVATGEPAARVGAGEIDPAIFRAATTVLDGFDDPGMTGPRAGDRVLLGVVARNGRADTVRFLEVTLLADGRAPRPASSEGAPIHGALPPADGALAAAHSVPATITLRDDDATVLSRRLRAIATSAIENGLFGSADILFEHARRMADGEGPDESLSFSESFRVSMGLSSMVQIVMAISDNDAMLPMIWHTIDKPPPLTWLGHLDLEVAVREADEITREVARLGPHAALPAYRVPLALHLRKRTLLHFDVLAVPLEPPLGLCGGVVAIDARHPRKPGLSVHIRLLAARRGGEGD